MTRTNSEVKSMLPKYKVEKIDDLPGFEGYLLVLCPKEDCPSHLNGHIEPFLVHQRSWQRPKKALDGKTIIRGRPCPYCSRVSAIR